jgi:hypothetical protein
MDSARRDLDQGTRPDRCADGRQARVQETARAAAMTSRAHPHHEVRLSQNLPPFTRGDLIVASIAIAGTIVAIVLAATGPGVQTAAGATQILIAMGISLINMAHVVGLLLIDSVGDEGAGHTYLRTLSAIATPAAVLANLLISLLA